MAKKVLAEIKLQIGAGDASPKPPVGPALGAKGANIMEFCKAFNAQTQSYEAKTPIPVVITVYVDKTFTFITKLPPNSYYIRKACGVDKGSKTPGLTEEGTITQAQVREIATAKLKDLGTENLDAACEIIKGSARSMGIRVVAE